MKITRISVFQRDLPLTEPYRLSGGRPKFEVLDAIFVKLETDAGVTGWGEGTPWGHTYVPVDRARAGGSARRRLRQLRPRHRVIREGHGSRVTDENGTEYVDYLIGWGPMLLGHGHPEVLDAVREHHREQRHVGQTRRKGGEELPLRCGRQRRHHAGH